MEENKIIEGLKSIDARIDQIMKDAEGQKASRAETDKKLAELGEAQLKFARQLLELQQKRVAAEGQKEEKLSIGAELVKSAAYAAFKETGRAARIGVKSTLTTAGLTNEDKRPGIVSGAEKILALEALLPSLPTTASSIRFVKEGASVNGAGMVAEGAEKPESTIAAHEETVPVEVVATWTNITRQLADDQEALAAFVNYKLSYYLDDKVDSQLLTGDGTTPNLSGLMKAGNYTAQAFTKAQLGGNDATLLDLIRMSIAQVNSFKGRCNAILMNPMDWAMLQGAKNASGDYLLGSAISTGATQLWGVPVVQCASMASGKFLVGDFTKACTVYKRQGTEILMSGEHAENFTHNLYTIRAERRMALAVERPYLLVGGNLQLPSA